MSHQGRLTVFGKKKPDLSLDKDVAMRIFKDGKARDVSYQELLLSINLTVEALMSVLMKKKIINPDELLDAIEEIRSKHQSESQKPASDPDTDKDN